jgi:hypothetical protein
MSKHLLPCKNFVLDIGGPPNSPCITCGHSRSAHVRKEPTKAIMLTGRQVSRIVRLLEAAKPQEGDEELLKALGSELTYWDIGR